MLPSMRLRTRLSRSRHPLPMTREATERRACLLHPRSRRRPTKAHVENASAEQHARHNTMCADASPAEPVVPLKFWSFSDERTSPLRCANPIDCLIQQLHSSSDKECNCKSFTLYHNCGSCAIAVLRLRQSPTHAPASATSANTAGFSSADIPYRTKNATRGASSTSRRNTRENTSGPLKLRFCSGCTSGPWFADHRASGITSYDGVEMDPQRRL